MSNDKKDETKKKISKPAIVDAGTPERVLEKALTRKKAGLPPPSDASHGGAISIASILKMEHETKLDNLAKGPGAAGKANREDEAALPSKLFAQHEKFITEKEYRDSSIYDQAKKVAMWAANNDIRHVNGKPINALYVQEIIKAGKPRPHQ